MPRRSWKPPRPCEASTQASRYRKSRGNSRKINHVRVMLPSCSAGRPNAGEDASMPHRSGYYNLRDHPSYTPNTRPRRPIAATAGRLVDGYTFAHAGRQIRLGPIAFWIVVGTLVIMAIWTITTATYFAFREDV